MSTFIDELKKWLTEASPQEKSSFIAQIKNEKALLDAFREAGLSTEDLSGRAREIPQGVLSKIMKVDLVDLITEISVIDKITQLDLVSAITNIANITNITNLQSVDLIDNITNLGTLNLLNTVNLIKSISSIDAITNIANLQNVDLIDNITSLGTLNLLNTVNLIKSISSVDSITALGTLNLINTVSLVSQITNIASVDLIDEITEIKKATLLTDDAAINGTDIEVTGQNTPASGVFTQLVSYTVPNGKTLLIYDWAVLLDGVVGDVGGYIYNATDMIWLGLGGGARGFAVSFSKPKRVTQNKMVTILVIHNADGNQSMHAHFGGILI